MTKKKFFCHDLFIWPLTMTNLYIVTSPDTAAFVIEHNRVYNVTTNISDIFIPRPCILSPWWANTTIVGPGWAKSYSPDESPSQDVCGPFIMYYVSPLFHNNVGLPGPSRVSLKKSSLPKTTLFSFYSSFLYNYDFVFYISKSCRIIWHYNFKW